MSQRTLASFERARLQRYETGPIGFCLSGEERGGSQSRVEVFFIPVRGSQGVGDAAPPLPVLPTLLHDVDVLELDDGKSRSWQLKTAERTLPVHARAVQTHRPAARAFFRAVPQAQTSWRARLGWSALLALLRVPGAARLIASLGAR